jgi:ankyrin repeat protein
MGLVLSQPSQEIHRAAEAGDVAAVKALLDASPGLLEERDVLRCTPLLEAASEGKTEVLLLLIDRGADLRAVCGVSGANQGYNALHMAAVNGHTDAAEILIKSGVEINAKSVNGETPLDVAVRCGQTKLARVLKSHGAVRGTRSK